MKTLNYKLLSLILLTTFFQGCLPDSLTKFKKDTPKAAATSAPGVSVTDSTGAVIDPSSITYPTVFAYRDAASNTLTNWYMTYKVAYGDSSSSVYIDGSLNSSNSWTALYKRCELNVDSTDGNTDNDALPDGIFVNTSICKLAGVPNEIYSSTALATLGQPVPYKVKLVFKNIKGWTGTQGNVTCDSTECYIISNSFNLAVYKAPTSLSLTQNDRLGLELTNFVADINKFTVDDANTTTRTDIITSNTGSMGSSKIIDSKKNILYILRAIPLTVDDTTGFTVGNYAGTFDTIIVSSSASFSIGDTVTTNAPGSYTGVVSSKSGTTLRIIRNAGSGSTLGTQLNGVNITSSSLISSPVYGTIMSVDTTNKIIRVTQSTDYPGTFGIGTIVTPYGQGYAATISSVDTSDAFIATNKVDNDDQFYSPEANITNSTQYYSVGTTISPIKPIIGSNDSLTLANGITYSISPALPTGLTFCVTTSTAGCAAYGAGYIIGSFSTELDPTTFTVTATNALGSSSYSFKLAAIYKPLYLSYSKNEIVKITNSATNPTAVYYEGEKVFQPIVAPATESIQGVIRRKFKDTTVSTTEQYLELWTMNGLFKEGASIDSGRKYISEKGYISATNTPYPYNLVIYTSTAVTNFNVGDIITNSGSPKAYARITYKNSSRNTLYALFLTPDVTSYSYFNEGDTITDATTAASTTISRLEAERYKLTLSNFVSDIETDGFTTGQDITTYNATSKVGGYIYDYDSTNNYVYIDQVTHTPSLTNSSNVITTHYPEFVTTQTALANENYATSTVSISAVSHDNLFIANRGESFFIYPTVSQGTNLHYKISPDLPAGLTIDADTGIISGTPTYLTPKKTYTITASNLLGKSQYQFKLEVRDYFTLAESSTATSYQLHKYGDTQNIRDCRINATDILNGTGNLDIRCFLDAEEQDLFQVGLKLQNFVGPGVCEFVQYTPFSFQSLPANTKADTPPTINVVTGCSTAAGLPGTFVTTPPTTADSTYCPSNYTETLGSTYPNCDEYSYSVTTYTTDDTTPPCTITGTATTKLKCGGNKYNCLKGPIRDIFDEAKIQAGYSSLIYEAADGDKKGLYWTHKSSLDRGYYSNISLANSTTGNTLTNSQSDVDVWMQYISDLNYNAKFGSTEIIRNAALQKTPFTLGSPMYIVSCLDAAYDIKARIRVQVRDWDRSFKVTDSIDMDSPISGTCSSSTYTTQATCTGAGKTWVPKLNTGSMKDAFNVYYNMYEDWDNNYVSTLNGYHSYLKPAANYAGSCSNNLYSTSSGCTGAGGTWTAATCSNVAYTNFKDCYNNGATWSPISEYGFPASDL